MSAKRSASVSVSIPATAIASKENKKLAQEIENKIKAEAKKPSNNGCSSTYKAYAVLMKKDVDGGLHIMRTLTITDGVVVDQVDNVEDLAAVQIGKAIIGLEEVLR